MGDSDPKTNHACVGLLVMIRLFALVIDVDFEMLFGLFSTFKGRHVLSIFVVTLVARRVSSRQRSRWCYHRTCFPILISEQRSPLRRITAIVSRLVGVQTTIWWLCLLDQH